MVRKKRTLARWVPTCAVLIAASAALFVAGCGGGDDSSGSGTSAAGDGGGDRPLVGLLAPETNDNTYSAAYVKRMEEIADKEGVDLKIYNAKYDAATQASQAESLLAQDPDGIILWPADSRAVRPILLKAQAAGIPVNASNSEPSEEDSELIETYTGPSNAQIGETVADLFNKALGGKGKLVIVEGQPGNATNIERVEAFEERLGEAYPGIEIAGGQPAFWLEPKAISVTTQFLSRFSNDIQGVYGVDDILASGAAKATAQAGIPKGEITIIGTGANALGLPLVASGEVYATLFQSPIVDAELAIENMLKVLDGEPVPPTTFMEMPVVTEQNASEFEPLW